MFFDMPHTLVNSVSTVKFGVRSGLGGKNHTMSALNQARALSRIRRALADVAAEITDSEREYLEAGGVLPEDINIALRAFHVRARVANGLITEHAKATLEGYDDMKTPVRSPSAMMRAVRPEETNAEQAQDAFRNSVELASGRKKPPGSGG